jgi:exonuclease III
MNGDIIHLIETSLEEDEDSPLILLDYEYHLTSAGRGKGIATYYKASKFKHEEDFKTKNMQITKFSAPNLDVMNVYRSSSGNSQELLAKLVEMMTPGKPIIITGDFNICFMNHGKNRMSKGLIDNEGLQQLMMEPTHILGGHIDHVYWKDHLHIWMEPILERYTPYYSDHDASCITLVKQVSFN